MDTRKLLINGDLVDGDRTLDVVNPATGTAFTQVACASAAQVEQAVEAAHAAFPAWAATSIDVRRSKLNELADALHAQADDFARMLTREQGKPLAEAQVEIAFTEAFIRYFAGLDLPVETIVDDARKKVQIFRRPLGAVAAIIPWNFPVLIVAFKLPPALLAGNTIIVKPAASTPATTLMLGTLARDIFPAGVVNVVTDDNDLGPVLTAHPKVAKVSFTGSAETGKNVMASAASTLKRITLELGGNDPAVILDDVDVEATAPKLFDAAFMNCGQVCLALKRAYVHERIYDEMCEALGRLARDAIVDDGAKQGTQIGPIQNRDQFEKVKGFLEDAKESGTIVAGGNVIDRDGFFIEPTIVRDVRDGDRIVDEEQFGPILPVIKFDDVDEVIARVNNTPYGLGGSVWAADVDRAAELAACVESGTVWVNQHLDFGPNIPFGGAKQSGIGVEFTEEGLKEFTQIQVINIAK